MRYTEAPARRAELLRRLSSEGYVSSAALAEELGVSEMTIRRDLRQLHSEGQARRVAGGASLPAGGVRGTSFEERDLSASLEKAAIAAACAERLSGAATIALDAGTTVAGVAALLSPGTTVVTHSMPVLSTCTERDDLSVIGLGGTYQPSTRSFGGQATRDGISRVSIDVAVLSATAVDTTGLLCANDLDAEVKQAMSAAARHRILLVDSGKIGARAPIRFGTLDAIDLVITSATLSAEGRDLLAAAHDVLYVADPLEEPR
ncbi:DeoR/GlpR family DNA-binding transcription regulator [Naasia sp. SYSU D00948]|uniref:DeoR/GlpR family DNA-binding transcription regulator n=1 Tax=Naasia sp. SYSU D00948 TaxID=2817379 RepID=UPI001B3071A8|nr:DeoR/GlpR family DNA-binding transcription regulator [Naasia sp. SYSU D00948]